MKTRFTELLGIKHPIIQSGMGLVADANLVSATCNAGGLGILATWQLPPEGLREEIRKVKKAIGGKPFGVNLTPLRPGFKNYVKVLLEEKVPVWNSGLGDPFRIAGLEKPKDVIYIGTVGTGRQAASVVRVGADAVIVQGWEGGGHSGRIASTVLIPEGVEAVKIPVVAAGGFCDGKGLAAAMALGADGIAMGTRFAISKESPIPMELKKKYLEAGSRDAVMSDVWDGLMLRAIPGEKRKNYHGWWTHPWDVMPNLLSAKKAYQASFKDMMATAKIIRQMRAPLIQYLVGMETYRKGLLGYNLENAVYTSGQVTGRIREILTCAEVIQNTVSEAEQIIKSLYDRQIAGSL
ncbi:NAD(P)H-dependent flavin oxidoreductase [Chloroflexota bacterium]